MATVDDVKQTLLDTIAEGLKEGIGSEAGTRGVVNLAEAYAWLTSPNQPHGGK